MYANLVSFSEDGDVCFDRRNCQVFDAVDQ